METYIYLIEVYKHSNNNSEINHYVWNAYTTKEKAIEEAKNLIKMFKSGNDRILEGNGDNCIGGIINSINNNSEIFWINEVRLK